MLGKPVWQAFEGEEKGDSWAERGVRACEEGGRGAGVPPSTSRMVSRTNSLSLSFRMPAMLAIYMYRTQLCCRQKSCSINHHNVGKSSMFSPCQCEK